MTRNLFFVFALALATPATAQDTTFYDLKAMGLPDGFSMDVEAEVDGNPATNEFIATNWDTLERLVMVITPTGQFCFGVPFRTIYAEYAYWAFPIKINGKTHLVTDIGNGMTAVKTLTYPTCNGR